MKKRELNLYRSSHRRLVARAYHELLAEGRNETDAKRLATKRALENWSNGKDRP